MGRILRCQGCGIMLGFYANDEVHYDPNIIKADIDGDFITLNCPMCEGSIKLKQRGK